jgi:geranylgeranyl transferase type-2 subunit beta
MLRCLSPFQQSSWCVALKKTVLTMSYLADLTLRLAAGALRLPEPARRRHGAFFSAAQNPDGGFSGRQGPSDLYYTSFALRGLALLGCLEETTARAAGGFFQQRLQQSAGVIDFLSLVYGSLLVELATGDDVLAAGGRDRGEWVAAMLGSLRRDDGGYAKSPKARQSSTYATFLATSCLQLVELSIDQPAKIVALVRSRQQPDGGFVEVAPLKQSGTNPTAAAVGLLRMLDSPHTSALRGAADFLAGMQNLEGGFRANTRIPIADLLSTFTGVLSLADLGALASIDVPAARRYVEALEQPDGGFRGGAWDDAADVEYTFYGLGSLALLAESEA